jgi:FdhD protein
MPEASDSSGTGPFPGLGHASAVGERAFTRLDGDTARPDSAAVAEEVPVAFVYQKRTHAVMMATPLDLEDLAVGFTLSEQIVPRAADIAEIQVERHSRGIEVNIAIPAGSAAKLADRARALSGRTGCGLCGVEAIDDAIRQPSLVNPQSSTVNRSSSLVIHPDALWKAAAALDSAQQLNRETHAIHGAAWATADGELKFVREDVGRHNALDKVLGALTRANVDARTGFLVVTSRASFELVQKAAVFGVPLLAAVSRPTGLAIRMADAAGMCLVGLLRSRGANVYAHAERIAPSP